LNMTGERSEMLQPARSQPSGDTNEQLHSTRLLLPTNCGTASSRQCYVRH
jgi:hypothetical protein